MADYIVRATAANAQIRAFAITSRDTVEHARSAHDLSQVVTAALGRLMNGRRDDGQYVERREGSADAADKRTRPVRSLVVTADAGGHVKGYGGQPAGDDAAKQRRQAGC